MSKRYLFLIVIFTLLISLVTPAYAVKTENTRIAKVIEVKGDVKVFKKGISKSFNAFNGMSLTQGDIIKTGKASWLTMKFDDDKDMKLSENSRIDINTLSGSTLNKNDQTQLQLWNGKIWVDIQKALNVDSKFEIKTPTSIAGVKGTKFFVTYSDEKLDIGVITGKVQADVFTYEKTAQGLLIKKESVIILEKNETITFNSSTDAPEKISKKIFDIEKCDPFIKDILINTPQYVNYVQKSNEINMVADPLKNNGNTIIPANANVSSSIPASPSKSESVAGIIKPNTVPSSNNGSAVSMTIPSNPQRPDNKPVTMPDNSANKGTPIKEQQEKDDKTKKEQEDKDKKEKDDKAKKELEEKNKKQKDDKAKKEQQEKEKKDKEEKAKKEKDKNKNHDDDDDDDDDD